jgi:hypothetical protein
MSGHKKKRDMCQVAVLKRKSQATRKVIDSEIPRSGYPGVYQDLDEFRNVESSVQLRNTARPDNNPVRYSRLVILKPSA